MKHKFYYVKMEINLFIIYIKVINVIFCVIFVNK